MSDLTNPRPAPKPRTESLGAPVPVCTETHLNACGFTRRCCRPTGHDGDHMEADGTTWEPPTTVLPRLYARWGLTHRFAWTGQFWMATDLNPRSRWRSEIEPTPELLEASLRRHHGDPPGPAPENAPHTPEEERAWQRQGERFKRDWGLTEPDGC
ncbi:hypothetical protein [Nocardiopsis sp. JB363]|uniref:hypothetical protein n=1 Tax=Nocardiopsis sp. JB363 TaxID=1434837 RepID=UPI00190EB4BF|nr:hypothetical protein [Nocardiopsis sp. JB363]